MSKRLATLLCLVALASAPVFGAPAQTMGNPELSKDLVDIGGGRRLNIVCVGQGSPTVVFEQGWGGGIRDWQKVAGPVSALTRACFYDRAGAWWSDPAVRPSTARNVTDDLRVLLKRRGITGPIVLVGHSLGGVFATLYADRFPHEVAGLVLVDPSFAGQYATPADQAANAARSAKAVAYLRGCAALARAGKLSSADPHHCFDRQPAGYSEAETAFLMPQALRPFRYEANASEMEMSVESREQEQRAARKFGSMPVIVLTHGARGLAPGESEDAYRTWEDHLKSGHRQLAARSSRGTSKVVPGAGHYIQEDQPQAVIEAIENVVSEVRRPPQT